MDDRLTHPALTEVHRRLVAPTALTQLAGAALFPDFSPDGTRVVFGASRGTSQQDAFSSPAQELGPAWSPDRTQIAYLRVNPGGRPPWS